MNVVLRWKIPRNIFFALHIQEETQILLYSAHEHEHMGYGLHGLRFHGMARHLDFTTSFDAVIRSDGVFARLRALKNGSLYL